MSLSLHPRDVILIVAKHKFDAFMNKLWEDGDLTIPELIEILSLKITHLNRYSIRDERNKES